MNDKDKRLIVEKVGLCWHEWGEKPHKDDFKCSKCKENVCEQLDPLDPADMYGKIIPAFKKDWQNMDNLLGWSGFDGWGVCEIAPTLTSAPDLAESILEYFTEKEKNDS